MSCKGGFFRGLGNGVGMWSFTRSRYWQSMFIPELTIFNQILSFIAVKVSISISNNPVVPSMKLMK